MHAGEALSLPNHRRYVAQRLPGRRALRIATVRELHCQFHPADALPDELAAQWSVLADTVAEPNCFSERWFLEPSLALLAERDDVRLAAVVSSDGLLAGLIPLTVKPDYGRIPVAHVQNWVHHNSFLGAPIVRRGMEEAFWTALLDALDKEDWASGLLHITGLTAGSLLLAGLQAAAADRGKPSAIVHRIERALLASDLDPQAYWELAVRKKKRKEIDRLAKRLADCGVVAYRSLGPDEDCEPWIGDFLALEAHGWKGEAGSALSCDPKIAAFFRTVCSNAHQLGKLDIQRIDIDGKAIAMLVNFIIAPVAFSFKIAFDEAYARYSPGVLLQRYNLKILDRAAIDWMDSCATENHPMINSMWRERRTVVRVSVALGGRRNALVYRLCRAAERSAAAVRAAQRLFGRRRA